MASTVGEEHRKDIVKTLLPIFLGFVAGIISFAVLGTLTKRHPLGIVILVFVIYIHKFLMPKFDVELENKDWGVISFLCFSSWYISWTLLLNA
ncbi:hypothetical protein DRP05_06360 [Archaeoglobales archaeon]|nr:MAG: hypothetical protein DRP05_06360 [Archaeoglobales archaeon]